MDYEAHKFKPQNHSPKVPIDFDDSKRVIWMYTGLRVLRQIRRNFGLEVMLQYMDQYSSSIEHANPLMKTAVTQALARVNMQGLVDDAMGGKI